MAVPTSFDQLTCNHHASREYRAIRVILEMARRVFGTRWYKMYIIHRSWLIPGIFFQGDRVAGRQHAGRVKNIPGYSRFFPPIPAIFI